MSTEQEGSAQTERKICKRHIWSRTLVQKTEWAKVALQSLIWKIIQKLTDNNARTNSVLCVLRTVSLLLLHPVYKELKSQQQGNKQQDFKKMSQRP